MSAVTVDTSEWNPELTGAYNHDLVIFRGMFGNGYLDNKFLHNASEAKALHDAGRIAGAIAYTVYLGSQSVASQYAGLWHAIGPTVPSWLLGVEIDVEHWGGTSYAISGDHSTQLNQLFGMHAGKMKSWTACIGYGNHGDLASIWPRRDPRCKVIVADYSGRLTYKDVRGAIGQQYTDGKWAAPPGLPTSSPPFGHVDHNVFPGFKNGAALRAYMRPKAPPAPKPVLTPPPRKPDGLYPDGVGNSRDLVSPDRHWQYIPTNDGRIEVRHDHQHVRYI